MMECNTVILLLIQGEDEVMFMEYRRELKVLFDNITQLVSHLQLCVLLESIIYYNAVV